MRKGDFLIAVILTIAVLALVFLTSSTRVIGFIAFLISLLIFVPQAVRAFQYRHDYHSLASLSVLTQFLVVANGLVWFIYAYRLRQLWVVAPGFVNIPLALFMIYVIYRARGRIWDDLEKYRLWLRRCPYCGWSDNGVNTAHEIYIDTPPGLGSTVECGRYTAYYGHPIKSNKAISVADQLQGYLADHGVKLSSVALDYVMEDFNEHGF